MTNKQPEALRLAEQLALDADDIEEQTGAGAYEIGGAADCAVPRMREAAIELLRLHEVNAELVEALRLVQPIQCDNLHHEKKHRHSYAEPCPVKEWIDGAIAKAQGDSNDTD